MNLIGFSQVPGVDFDLGPKMGVNLSQLNASGGNMTEPGKNALGYFGGLFGMIKLTKFGIQPEAFLSYDKPTFNLDTSLVNLPSTAQQVKTEVQMLNLHIPLLAKYYIIDNEAFGLSLFAGPQFSMLLSQATKVNGQDFKDANGAKQQALKNSNVSAVAGIGIDLPLGFRVDLRYNLGISNISNISGVENRIRMVQFSVGKSLF